MIVPKQISDSESLFIIIKDKIYHKKSLSKQINNNQALFIEIEDEIIEVRRKDDNYLVIDNDEINLDKDQHSYNIPTKFLRDAKNEEILIENTEILEGDSRPDDVKYVLNDYEFKLGSQLLWLIGEDPRTSVQHKFLAPNPQKSKPQIHRSLYDNLSQHDKGYEWFVKLYDKNLPGNVLTFELDKEKKILTLDIDFNALTKDSSTEFINENDFPHNRIIFGAPGTGKSQKLENDRKILLYGNEGNFERVTFHPDYSYAHFVGTYKPISINKSGKDIIYYKYVPGPFLRVLVEALNNPAEKYLLLIEEINRANVAAVFGDVFQLLDRNNSNCSEYSINTSNDMRKFLKENLKEGINFNNIRIPSNMYIWATMNSADQGVFMMDTAFKRRWDFEYLGINHSESEIQNKFISIGKDKIDWNSLRKAINKSLSKKINEDKLLGPFFISPKYLPNNRNEGEIHYDFYPEESEGAKQFVKIFKNKVLMYLFEDAGRGIPDKIFNENLVEDGKVLLSEIFKEFEDNGIEVFSEDIIKCYRKFRENTEYSNFKESVSENKEYGDLVSDSDKF